MSQKEKRFDDRIGKHGHYEPLVCALSGEPLRARHQTHFSLGNGYYGAILRKAKKAASDEEIIAAKSVIASMLPKQATSSLPRSKRARAEDTEQEG